MEAVETFKMWKDGNFVIADKYIKDQLIKKGYTMNKDGKPASVEDKEPKPVKAKESEEPAPQFKRGNKPNK